jgi:hypothetical protein
MLEMNDRNDRNADGSGTYGTYGNLSAAIVSFVKNQTGIDISNGGGKYGWNLGGNHTYADDIQSVIDYELAESIRDHASTNDADAIHDNAGAVAIARRHYDANGAQEIRVPSWPADYHAPATWHAMSPEQAAAAVI